MRSFLTYGLISIVAVASLYACGDDSGDDDGPRAGAGGSAGQGGSGGQGGGAGTTMAGSGGSAGSTAGNGGSGGAGPDVTPQATCTGCVELITPVVGPNSDANVADQAIFQFTYPAPGIDFSNAVITWRVMPVQNNDNYFLNAFAQNGQALGFAGVYPTYITLGTANFPAGEWRDVVLDLSAYRGGLVGDAGVDAGEPPVVADAGDAGDAGGGLLDPGNFVKERVETIGIQIGVTAAFTGSATVRVAVDSVTITGVPGQPGYTFDANAEGLVAHTFQQPPGTPAPVFH